ncbi:MAG: single-stranded DNA-binding protein [Oscillospiraceae bacterium]
MGRLTRDPGELRRTANGTAVTSFTVAVDRDFTNDDGSRDTDFIDCIAWKTLAETVNRYFAKGRMAVVRWAAPNPQLYGQGGNQATRSGDCRQIVSISAIPKRGAKPEYNAPQPQDFSEVTEDDPDLPLLTWGTTWQTKRNSSNCGWSCQSYFASYSDAEVGRLVRGKHASHIVRPESSQYSRRRE